VIGAEKLAASIAMELVAAGAEHLAAGGIGTGADFEEGIATVLVVFDREALKERVASGAGSGGEFRSHGFIMLEIQLQVKHYFTLSLSFRRHVKL
jgi:hypothetical protein